MLMHTPSVQETFGGAPSTIVFNAYGPTPPREVGNIFSIPLDSIRYDPEIAVTGPYVATREAYDYGYIQANKLLPKPAITTLGLTKRASYYLLGVADKLYREQGFRFLFAEQRSAQSGPNNTAGPEEYVEIYEEIMKNPDEFPFYVTFVDGTKFVPFEDKEE
ncbi:hypothetical protein SCAR479_01577 [Seiridium cardinale]|uniref:Uncharacterized protein n=1 Tax=Seiridium cardinale TaxID=138064 RepID=A0ABR2Y5U4_9PEZI